MDEIGDAGLLKYINTINRRRRRGKKYSHIIMARSTRKFINYVCNRNICLSVDIFQILLLLKRNHTLKYYRIL